ncbi:hypothetical protein LB523_28505 [Mesorhizobium sp. ESP-6-4]|uniref:hypothetical protein n=1 Tax=Mesorhizobium sp. ESP-6-4 TaxID=2876624 RepID=UPI001CCA8617|nr:hypothetical protein [Mesorhizobium sp. ESP-6-4]MBZ9662994.1 hypothetical protein [Mesorhizobium sp. ESP-6-4]
MAAKIFHVTTLEDAYALAAQLRADGWIAEITKGDSTGYLVSANDGSLEAPRQEDECGTAGDDEPY